MPALMKKEHTQHSRQNKDDLTRRIGGRLKELRKAMGLSMRQLAEATDLSPPFFSRIENGLVMPSIQTLQLIADFLKVDLTYFFKKEEERGYVITRQGSRRMAYARRGSKGKVTYGLELLADGMENPFMEPCIVTEFAGPSEEFQLAKHDGQEFIYVLDGKLELTLGEKRFSLDQGDAAYFIGEIPHGGKSISKRPARTLNVHLIPGTRIGTFRAKG
jgi:transcriptional regulator with XRE-family HTH domain